MEQVIEKIKGSKIKIIFALTPEETVKYVDRALKHLNSEQVVKGFRPGKVPLQMLKSRLGDDTINQETMLAAVRELYPKLATENNLETIGQPEVNLILASPLSFSLTVVVLPEVDLGKWDKIKIARKPVSVSEVEIAKLLTDIREGRASEAAVTRAAKLGDLVDIDFEISFAKVVIEDGKQSHYKAILGKGQLIFGFEEAVVGVEPGQEKTFSMKFPDNYRPPLAGQEAQVKLKLNQLFERQLPELTDAFAASLGSFKSVADLNEQLKKNMLDDHTFREEERAEREMLEEMLKAANFTELPEMLVEQELDSMVHELSHSVEQRGLSWPDYLSHLKKDESALRQEFKSPAEKRVKLALLTRALARAQNFAIEDSTIEAELAPLLAQYTNDSRTLGYLQGDDYRAYLKSRLLNQRVIEWLKQKLVK